MEECSMREKYEIQPLLEKHNNWFNMYKKVLVLVNTFIILNSLKIKKSQNATVKPL